MKLLKRLIEISATTVVTFHMRKFKLPVHEIMTYKIIFKDPDYCHIYHYCLPGVHTIMECGQGLWYSEPHEACVWPSEAECAVAPASNKTTTNPPEFTTPEAALVYGTIECPDARTSFHPDPYDCSAFHFCNGGKAKVLKCEPGLFFDRKRGTCDWRKNVQCK